MFEFLIRIWGRKPKITPQSVRRTVDSHAIRARIQSLGWNLREIPVRGHQDGQVCIKRWKLIALRGDRSCEVGGTTLDEALQSMGRTLGVIARN